MSLYEKMTALKKNKKVLKAVINKIRNDSPEVNLGDADFFNGPVNILLKHGGGKIWGLTLKNTNTEKEKSPG